MLQLRMRCLHVYRHLGLIDGEYVCIHLHWSLGSKLDCLAICRWPIYTPEDAVDSYYWQLKAAAIKSQLYLYSHLGLVAQGATIRM